MLDILIASAIATKPVEPNWVMFGKSNLITYYMDTNSIRGRGKYRTITLYHQSEIDGDSKESVAYIECSPKKFTTLTSHDIRELNRSELTSPKPDTVGKTLVDKVCGMIKK
ncbi:hypothetical protein [Nostoc sp. 106C]|uniref:hypothetical protein n=1 Tax=Nostoc sp. 106C TaxID=1932667 RepID=UPI000A3B33DD|nr:hypothetical protein [Nostoc sp. 106C]OUL17832.1 hypothetical protein BV375_34935 [Nostoc sp. 106C]